MKLPRMIGELIIKEKICNQCKKYKSITQFHICRKRKDGLGYIYQPYCIDCERNYTKKTHKNNLAKDPNYYKKRSRLRRLRRKPWQDRLDGNSYHHFGRSYRLLTKKEKKYLLLNRLFRLKEKSLINEEFAKKMLAGVFELKETTIENIFTIKLRGVNNGTD